MENEVLKSPSEFDVSSAIKKWRSQGFSKEMIELARNDMAEYGMPFKQVSIYMDVKLSAGQAEQLSQALRNEVNEDFVRHLAEGGYSAEQIKTILRFTSEVPVDVIEKNVTSDMKAHAISKALQAVKDSLAGGAWMSEISDAVQIIRVGYDTIEIAMKVGSGSIEMMQKAVNLLIGLLEHEKTMGKTNLKGLLEKGGDIQVLTFADEDLKKFQKLAKKYGILYSVMPDADRRDGITEVLFHSEAAPRLRMICQKLKNGRMFDMDEYLKNGNEEQLNQLLDFLEKEKKGKKSLHTDVTEPILDGLIEKVGHYAMEKKAIRVEDIQNDFQMESKQAEDVLHKLKTIGVVSEPDGQGNYPVVMDQESFEKRINRYRELSNRMRQIAAAKNTALTDITITKQLIAAENDHAVKTRVPGMYGSNVGYIWIRKEDIMEIHNGKTLLTYLDKEKDYKIYSEDNRVLYTMKGEDLYAKHYDRVERTVRERYQKVKQSPDKNVIRTHSEVRRR